MTTKINKILVIGASIAGPAVCYWLKRFGFSPTLIEKNDSLRKGGYAIDIRGIATEVIKKMGIYEKAASMRTQLEYGRYVDSQGNTLHEEQGEKLGFRQAHEIEIILGDLVEILMETIKDVPCYFNQTIDQIKQHEENVEVIFKDGRTEYYDLIIGADGLHSFIREHTFSEREYDVLDLGCYISVFSTPNYLKLNRSEIFFEANQKLVHISSDKNPDMALVGLMFRSNHKLNDIRNVNEQKNFLKDTFFNLGWETNNLLKSMQNTNDFYFDAIMQIKMKSWTKGRIALVGDSGYCASPLSGQGTSLAIVGAYILAGELKAAGEHYAVAFERYNTVLRPFVSANQDFGVWASETFLLSEKASKAMLAERADTILEKLKTASHAIQLPQYEDNLHAKISSKPK